MPFLGSLVLRLQLCFSKHTLQEERDLYSSLLVIVLSSASLAGNKQNIYFICVEKSFFLDNVLVMQCEVMPSKQVVGGRVRLKLGILDLGQILVEPGTAYQLWNLGKGTEPL